MDRVKLTVICSNDHEVGIWWDEIAEKYPFFCERCEKEFGCGDLRHDKYPWSLKAEAVTFPLET